MLVRMIEVAACNEVIMNSLKEKLSIAKSAELKLLLPIIINVKIETAQIIEAGLSSKTISINDNGETTELRSEDVVYALESIKKNLFRIKHEFTGTWGEATSAYREFAKTHNVGDSWDEDDVICCYEYTLEEKGEYAQKQRDADQQAADEASATAQLLGGQRLIGTLKQRVWGETIRAEKLPNVHDKKVLDKLLKQSSAKWWIDNKDLSIAELAKKRTSKAKEPDQKPTEEPAKEALTREEKLINQSALIAEKVTQLGKGLTKTALLDACLGDKSRVDGALAGTHLMNESTLKSFLTYAQ